MASEAESQKMRSALYALQQTFRKGVQLIQPGGAGILAIERRPVRMENKDGG